MSGKNFSFPGKIGFLLICLAILSVSVGCAPKIPTTMSSEDLLTCDDNAWEDEALSNNYANLIATHPYLALPGDVDLLSPAYGSILPYGEPVPIKFNQPTATNGVLFRNYRVIVTSMTGKILDRVGGEWAVVNMSTYNVQVTWTPPGSGKYIIHVFLRNLETLDWLLGNPANYSEELANPLGTYIHYGPFSVAHVCVQIDVPKAVDVVQGSPQSVNIQPLQNYTKPAATITKTLTLTPTMTSTFTFTPTFTATLPSTFTFTPLKPTFTSTKTPTLVRPTDIPPTPVIVCEGMDQRTCESHNDVCKWEPPVTGGPEICQPK